MGIFSWLQSLSRPGAPAPVVIPTTPPPTSRVVPEHVSVGTPSDKCIRHIQTSEGLVLTAMADVDGEYVIGYGCKRVDGKAVVKGQTITAADADRVCRQHAQECADAARAVVKASLTQGQLDALVDFVYNVGLGGFQQSTLLRMINAGNPVTERYFTMWNKIHKNGQVVELPTLTTRRKAEYLLWIS